MPEFLTDESCSRCKGPILAEPHTKTTFHEESFDYTVQTVWICYACGAQNLCGSTPIAYP